MTCCSIELFEEARVFNDRPYPMYPVKQNVVKDKVDKMQSHDSVVQTREGQVLS